MRRPVLAAAVAAVLLALVAAPAAAQTVQLQGDQVAIKAQNSRQAALIQAITAGFAQLGEDERLNRTGPTAGVGGGVQSAVAAQPPPVTSASPAEVRSAIATVMAAASIQSEALGTLGNPEFFKYPDGSGRVALWRKPVSRSTRCVCIFVHGCKHDPFSWFYKSQKCQQCTGLPEEVSHSKQCLAHGCAVLALMSKDREYRSRCFSSSGSGNDQPSAAQVIKAWLSKTGLASKPKYMFGVSSGAAFAIKFPKVMKLQGVVSEVNMPDVGSWLVDSKGRLTMSVPPVVYYQMDRDVKTAKQIAAGVKVLQKNKVPVGVVKSHVRNVTSDFLYQRSIYITRNQAQQIAFYLRKIGVIDKDGLITYDVRVKRGWTAQLPKYLPWLKRTSPYYNLISDESQIWQELNLAWSWHEIVSDFVRPTLIWLDYHGKTGQVGLNNLVKKYDLQGNLRCLTETREGCK